MTMQGPYDHDPPWSEGPPPEPERCANCDTERFDSDVTGCGSCGFTWQEIDNAKRVVRAITRELGITLTDEERHKAIDAALGVLVEDE